MRIGHFLFHTFAGGFADRAVFYFQGGGRIGGIVNILAGIPIPPIP